MASLRNQTRELRVRNVIEVVANKLTRARAGYFYSFTGERYYILDGKKITESEFETLYPVQLKPLNLKGENSDRTKNWMHGEKSY